MLAFDVSDQATQVLIVACVFDSMLGMVSALAPSLLLWKIQAVTVIGYTLVITLGLPEFFMAPIRSDHQEPRRPYLPVFLVCDGETA